MKLFIVVLLGFGCASQNKGTDSDKIVNEFKEAGQKVGKGIEKGVNNVKEGVCKFFNEETGKCED